MIEENDNKPVMTLLETVELIAQYQLNDCVTRNLLEDAIPNCICNIELNTSDVIVRNAIRLSIDNILYEYGIDGLKEV